MTSRTKAVSTDDDQPGPGRLVRVNGPLVEVEGLDQVAVRDVIEVGQGGLSAEVVSVRRGLLTAQVYEYTGGLRVGDPAIRRGRPLTALLGPHLLSGVFDGLLRPLAGGPPWLVPGSLQGASDPRRWPFMPTSSPGSIVGPGDILGSVPTTSGVDYRVLVPAGGGGRLEWMAKEGEVGDDEAVAIIDGREVVVNEMWPVRTADRCASGSSSRPRC